MTLAEKICSLRTRADMSQSDLAEATGVSRQSVSKWETGASVPDLDKLVTLSELFGVSLDELVKDEKPAAAQSQPSPVYVVERKAEKTAAQKVGIGLFWFSGIAAALGLVLFGALLVFIPLTLTLGFICYFAKKHPFLKASWAGFLILDVAMRYMTGIQASTIMLTPYWEPEYNYFRLFTAWVLFAVLVLLVGSTAITLRKDGIANLKKQGIAAGIAVLVFVATGFQLPIASDWYRTYAALLNVVLILHGWLRLWSITER